MMKISTSPRAEPPHRSKRPLALAQLLATAPMQEGRLLTLLLLSFAGCSEIAVDPAPIPTSITLSATMLSFVSLGETQQLTATVRDQSGRVLNGIAITWTSSAPAVASVSDAGLVTSVGNGKAVVRATSRDASAEASIVVSQAVVRLGTVEPMTWTSSDESVLRVNQTGVATPIARGAEKGVLHRIGTSAALEDALRLER